MHFCFTIPAFPNTYMEKKQFQNPYFIPFIPDFCIIIICQQSSWAADNICQIKIPHEIGIFFATVQGH